MTQTPMSLLQRLQVPLQPSSGSLQRDADWEQFVDLYTPLIYLWACRVGLQAQDAADLVQEVFLTLLQKLTTFTPEPGKSFRAWLHAVTLNKWRDQKRRKVVAVPGGGAVLAEVEASDAAKDLFAAEYQQFLVGRALEIMQKDFQPRTWKAVWSVVVEDKPAAAVAVEQGLTIAAVYTARSRVLRRLRQELAGILE